jgi:hypothetical protein
MMCLAAALLTVGVGCRNCGGGWFTSSRGSAPCQLVGRSDVILDPTGAPIGGGAPGAFVPGNGLPQLPGTPGTELPFPQPNDLIPRMGVPVPPAIPAPAPGDGGAAFLPAPKNGVPVKTTK